MRNLCTIGRFLNKMCIKRYVGCKLYLNSQCSKRFSLYSKRREIIGNNHTKCYFSVDSENTDSDLEDALLMQSIANEEQPVFTRNLLYPNTNDPLIQQINRSINVQELFTILSANSRHLNYRHVTQSVVVIWDLLKIFYHVHGIPDTISNASENNFVVQLSGNEGFSEILRFVETRVGEFDVESLSFVLLYLSKLGLNVSDKLFQLLVSEIDRKLSRGFSISAASRYAVALSGDLGLRSFFVVKNIVPDVFRQIGICKNTDDVTYLTVCLGNIRSFVTDEILDEYKSKICSLIDENVLTADEYKTVVKVTMFLNFPEWRYKNVGLMRRCLLLLHGKMTKMTSNEILQLSDVFIKIQEPAEILNQLQRCASKHLLQMEEEANPNIHTRLKLMVVVMHFTSSVQRLRYETWVSKYMQEDLIPDSLQSLRKILVHIKTSDVKLCQQFWTKMLKLAKNGEFDLIELCSEYTRFTVDIHNFRYAPFENLLLGLLEKDLTDGISQFFPSTLAHYSTFLLPYCKDPRIVDFLCSKLASNWYQLSSSDCLKISKALQIARGIVDNQTLTKSDVRKLHSAVNKAVMLNLNKVDSYSASFLLKSFIMRGDIEHSIVKYLIFAVDSKDLNSVTLKNVAYCLSATSSLMPDVMSWLVDYVLENKDHILGVNVVRVLFLCYSLNYHPNKPDEFFDAAIDVILRDEERLNTLPFLQTGLALAYFNVLPQSFIKKIFNESFLEKVDYELATCYSKTTYPARIRKLMMQLNRVVCLDYPEANVPWFHQKYVEETKSKELYYASQDADSFRSSIDEYLQILIPEPDSEFFEKEIWTPYGYRVDFVLNVNRDEEVVSKESPNVSDRLAIVLLKSKAYTQIVEQLKGQYQLQRRHLEILGYKVVFLYYKEWMRMVDDQEKLSYLRKSIWPKSYLKFCSVVHS